MTAITARLSTALADRYRIESHLGEGGMATVYLAEDLKHKRKVAVKVLRPELAAVLGAERFVQEITTTANLQHPHILPLFDSGEADSFLYYVMPFVEGETLRDKLNRETQLGIDEAVSVTTDIADALDYAHRNNVIHRDIKPENILLHDGRPMVADFGIALAVSAAAGGRMTETGLSLGTPHYMSPEQATAEKDLTNRSDIYSLGCVLYEMLTGSPPHVGPSAQAIVMKIVTEDAQPVTELRKSVPPHVAAATAKSLEKLAADRFESAAKFADALTNPAFTLPSTVTTPGMVGGGGGLWNRLSIGLAALAAVLLVTTLWGWLGARPEPSLPVARYSVALPEDETLRVRFGNRVALSPDGARLVYVGPGPAGVRLWTRSRDQLHATPVPGTDGAFSPTFSPDGSRVAFLAQPPNTIKVVALGGGPPITVKDSAVGGTGLSWGADGFLYGMSQGQVTRVALTGGVSEPVTTVDTAQGETSHRWPEALPGGKGVLFTVRAGTGMDDWNVAVVDLATGTHRVLVRGVAAKYAASGHLVYVSAQGTLLAAPFDQERLELTGEATALVEGVGVRVAGSLDLALSATGTLVYVTGSSSGGLARAVWVSRDGAVTPVDPDWLFDPGLPEVGVELSPDGTELAVKINTEAGEDIWVKQLDRGPLSRLTFHEAVDRRPRWTADGRRIMFTSRRAGQYDLHVRRADGTGPTELLLDLEQPILEVQRAPDGEWFVLRLGGVSGVTGIRDLVGLRQGDSVTVPLAVEPYDEKGAALSPDGRWLAYESNETGRNEIYVRPFPNAADGKWQVSADGGINPRWAHSGRELFYVNGAQRMVAAAVQTSAGFRVGERQVLFSIADRNIFAGANYAGWDVGSDDQRFLMVQIGGETAGVRNELIVVENFFEELKAKVGK